MKKTIILLSSLMSMVMFGQHYHEEGHYCASDVIRAELEKQNPEIKAKRLEMEKNLRKKGLESVLRESGVDLPNSTLGKSETMNKEQSRSSNIWKAYKGEIYEIPIVVHLIESNNPVDTKLTNEQIQTWIENANKILATTYGNGYYTEGEGIDKGAVMPFRLVLAKRTINNEPTTGIIRYDGSSLQGYNEYGMADYLDRNSRGVKEADIRRFAPHCQKTTIIISIW